ncbi:MAG: rubrerythrin family protein [Muribaculaceae bacterium]|nr:rubrerythrin family protein [Muribaculaceae bacterium]MDE6533772.1 rubrerythrin family protein [Muribaculaceae bacterium]
MSDTKSIKGTKTEQNLANSYVAESCAYSRYTFFAQTAQKESYFQYADIFNETAANELHHAKIYLKLLKDGGVTTAPIPIDPGVLTPTVDNLKVAAEEEKNEGVALYKEYAKVAEKEGFPDIAKVFLAIATVEQRHEDRFNLMRQRIIDGTVWKREKPIKWQCQVCGYIFEGKEPPEKCPACAHPYQHFMPEEDNY